MGGGVLCLLRCAAACCCRDAVAAAGKALGLDGTYIPHSYIEVVQLENLTRSFQKVTDDLKRRFAVNGEPLIDESTVGSFSSRGQSPMLSDGFKRTTGFSPTMAIMGGAQMSTSGAGGVHVLLCRALPCFAVLCRALPSASRGGGSRHTYVRSWQGMLRWQAAAAPHFTHPPI
jgi:hypothetical protein